MKQRITETEKKALIKAIASYLNDKLQFVHVLNINYALNNTNTAAESMHEYVTGTIDDSCQADQ